jgi:uncharacterized NAD-dependent epimerase/dehydratase family protein
MTHRGLREVMQKLEAETGLPAADVLTPEVSKLSDALLEYFRVSVPNFA